MSEYQLNGGNSAATGCTQPWLSDNAVDKHVFPTLRYLCSQINNSSSSVELAYYAHFPDSAMPVNIDILSTMPMLTEFMQSYVTHLWGSPNIKINRNGVYALFLTYRSLYSSSSASSLDFPARVTAQTFVNTTLAHETNAVASYKSLITRAFVDHQAILNIQSSSDVTLYVDLGSTVGSYVQTGFDVVVVRLHD